MAPLSPSNRGRVFPYSSPTYDQRRLESSLSVNFGLSVIREKCEGRAQTEENIVQSHMRPTQSGKRMSQRLHCVRQAAIQALPPLILGKSRMRKRARTDLCGGRPAMVVPTATVIHKNRALLLGGAQEAAISSPTRYGDDFLASEVNAMILQHRGEHSIGTLLD